ncbi:hypothetical protein V1525DRAFT_387078 [Lipomyces kononenkoae]|uniref:Uncharacterized protein n=1 Tax=Lipomyces kononenkoae TaxID=34357 RepID=A0ACC3T4L3_LIPKO
MHVNKTLVLLQKKLAETNLVITDSTIFTVLALAMLSGALDDLEATKKHIHGLYQLIKLRGGMEALARKYALQIKGCRLDLRFALKTGSKPLFFADDRVSKHEPLRYPE